MHHLKLAFTSILLFTLVTGVNAGGFDSVEDLGRALFFDTNFSKNRTQACATCHSPQHAFSDPRKNASGNAVSLGDDGHSLGDRNTPTLSYIGFNPEFSHTKEDKYVGGFFLDGREKNLVDQAKKPVLDPIEMAMPDITEVVKRIQENSTYVNAFKKFYGEEIFRTQDSAYHAMAESIAAFEKTKFFASFDSKYDRHLRGEYEMTEQEELGMTLFFSQQFSNCNICHQLKPTPHRMEETFSNYEYHNIGTPENSYARAVNGIGPGHVDRGLLQNPEVHDPKQAGKFKVPSLRNVAVTAPYMHNGVFENLRTVVLFYNKYNSRSPKRQINPETGKPWRAPEVTANISLKELETGPALDDRRIDALVAFMQTLTDKRYEHMLKKITKSE